MLKPKTLCLSAISRQRLIIDTNVLFAGLYSSNGASFQILKLVYESRIKFILSTTLLFEYEDVLKRKNSDLGLSNNEIDILLDNLCYLGKHCKIHFLWRPFLPDSKDDLILELAVGSGTKTIVTHNIKDFVGIDKFGVRAITPKKILEELR